MRLPDIEGAAGRNPALRKILTDIQNWMTGLERISGINPQGSSQGGSSRVAPPPLATLAVVGGSGQFTVTIANPVGAQGNIFHEIKTSSTIPFLASQTIITYGPSPSLSLIIIAPGETKYFQIRSRYQTSDFNAPQVFGPVAAGFVGSDSLPPAFSMKFPYTTETPIMAQSETDLEIIVHDIQIADGSNGVIEYDAANISLDSDGDPLTYDTYFVYVDDPAKDGGAVEYQATRDFQEVLTDDGRIFVGAITLRSIGGGVLFPQDMLPVAASGQLITLFGGSTAAVEGLTTASAILGADGVSEVVQEDLAAITGVPCFTIVTSTGKSVTLCAIASLQSAVGGRIRAVDAVPGDQINTSDGQEQVQSKTFAGLLTAYTLVLDANKFYLAGSIWVG